MLVGKDVMPKKLTKTPTKEGGKMKATGLGLAPFGEDPRVYCAVVMLYSWGNTEASTVHTGLLCTVFDY